MVGRTRSASRSGSSSSASLPCSRTDRGSARESLIRRFSIAGRPRSAGSSRTRSSCGRARDRTRLLAVARPSATDQSPPSRAPDRLRGRRDLRLRGRLFGDRRPRKRAGPHAVTLGAGARRGLHREQHRHLHLGAVRRGADLPRARVLAARAVRPLAGDPRRRRRSSGLRTASCSPCPSSSRSGACSRGCARRPTACTPAWRYTRSSTRSRSSPPSPSAASLDPCAGSSSWESRRSRLLRRRMPAAASQPRRSRARRRCGVAHRAVRVGRVHLGPRETARSRQADQCSTPTPRARGGRRSPPTPGRRRSAPSPRSRLLSRCRGGCATRSTSLCARPWYRASR